MRFLLQYFAITVCLIALAWAFVSVQVGEQTLYGHLIRTDMGGSLAARWNAWDPANPSVKVGANTRTEPARSAKEAKRRKAADEDAEMPAKLARATEPMHKGEPTVQTEKGAIRRVNRLSEAAAQLRN